MRKLIKMLSLVCVLAVSITAFSILALAAGPKFNDGDILKATSMAEEFLSLETDAEKVARAKELNAYLLANPMGQRYETAVFAILYGSAECDVCRGKDKPCSDCEGQMGAYAQYMYNRYNMLVEKIMAYAALELIESYDEKAPNYEQRSLSQWVERFIERGVGNYTVAEVEAEDFFDEFKTDTYVIKSVAADADTRKATYTITVVNPAKDGVSFTVSEALDADMLSAIDSVKVGDTALATDAYTYADGVLSINEAVAVPGVGFAEDGQTATTGTVVITVVASISESYVFPTAEQVNTDNEAPDSDDTAAGGDTSGDGNTDAREDISDKTLKELSLEISAKVKAKIQESLDALSDKALADYATEKIIFKNAFSDGSKSGITNFGNAVWYGRMYDNGYRPEDKTPTRAYSFDGVKFTLLGTGIGSYDRLTAGSYVIFDEDVTTYYVGSETNFTEREVKRNYLYDPSTGGFAKVADGKGLYDLIGGDGFGKLLPPSPYLYIDMTGSTITSSLPYTHWSGTATGVTNVVMQAEFTYVSTHSRIYIELYMYAPTSKGASFLTIENGNLLFNSAGKSADGTDYKAGTYVIEDVVVPGKWTNVILTIDGADMAIYVDYEKVYTTAFNYPENVVSFYGVRAGAHGDGGTGASSGHGIRNCVVYQGDSPRELDRFKNMGLKDKFVYFSDFLTKSGTTVPAQMYAYSQAGYLLPEFFTVDVGFEGSHIDEDGKLVGGTLRTDDENVIKAIKQYYTYDYDEAVKAYKTDNTAKYSTLVDALEKIDRRYNTIETRETAISGVDKFVASYSDSNGVIQYLDKGSDVYKAAKAKYDRAVKLLENDKLSFEFVENMEYFNNTTLYKKKLQYYEKATEALNSGVIDETITDAGETRLDNAYAIYDGAPRTIEKMVYVANSKLLVMYIEYTQSYDTTESWIENYDLLSYPLGKARDIIKTGKYDPDYVQDGKSLASLLIWYDTINSYFYDKLQEEHIAYIKNLQERYTQSDSYMEKLGICSEIERYVASADLDLDNPELKLLLDKNEEYLAEIDSLEAPYIEQRNKKTELFVAVIKKLDVSEGYNEMKALLEEAVSYYYTMTVGATDVITDEQITEAINKYNYYIEYEKKVVESSADFKIIVARLDGATTYAEYYTVLSEVQPLLDYVSKDIEGVRAAYDKYEMAYNSYMSITAPVRAEIQETQGSVISLRAGYCVSEILAIFAELVGSIVD